MHAKETLVVAKVQVRLGAVIGHVALAVLVGIKRAGIYVYVGVKLLDSNPQTSGLQ